MNVGINAPCNIYGLVFDDWATDNTGSIRFYGGTRSTFNINSFQFGNVSGGSDFAVGSGLAYFVYYGHKVDITAHALPRRS